jgi:hypothetical protein
MVPGGERRKIFLRHDGLHARPGPTQHRHGSQDTFDQSRAGADHLAFTVAGRKDLDAQAARPADAAVICSPVTAANSIPGAAVPVFLDPDSIQPELPAEPRHRPLQPGTPPEPDKPAP